MIQICTECLRTTADAMNPGRCFDGEHAWVDAVISDCPHARRDASGVIRHQWRMAANRECEEGSHHPVLAEHVSIPVESAEAKETG